ncbi:DEAD/DEAH box helicase [Paenalcaligenes niemegkensis]|uniref:DEAD/DEAH box helicase n=1 Tax=Paenalcaligenes niemegkensis TaxID=2895469 RepID=UPI001EE92EF1|nr:DEAD/DEAH box helicase [Paenalcaligenes niemegkensis]MCQ9617755.1 DEAD/DEAH box helicase [Paenalcaligenes niemegkensis]
MSFETLGLNTALLSAVIKAGFTTPTPVQEQSIPKAIEGFDLMVSAQTGSGKTAAFMLPALHKLAQNPPAKNAGVSVLVLTPTRELALQVAEATKTYGAHIRDLRVAVVVGGMPYGAQLKALSRRVDVLVATPGRLIDHINAKRVKLGDVHTLVLDEADRMLDMGFIEDIESIVSKTPRQRQTLLFSATLDGTIARLAGKMMNEPVSIEVSGHKQKHENITQALLYADDGQHKGRLLDHLLRDASLDQAIVFTSTKRGADELADRLCEEGFSAGALHGDMNQRQRTRTLGLLQRGRIRILVATDVAARGIDVQGISHAINYDLPMQPEDYTHRIGRTGRAGNSGLAYTLAVHSERHKVRRIEHFIGQPIAVEVIAGLEPTKSVRPTYSARKGKGAPRGRSGSGGGYAGAAGGGAGRFEHRRDNASAPRTPAARRDRPLFDERMLDQAPTFGASSDRPRTEQRGAKDSRSPRREGGFQERSPGGRPAARGNDAAGGRGKPQGQGRPSAGRPAQRSTEGRPASRPNTRPAAY